VADRTEPGARLLTRALRDRARAAGFDEIGIAPAPPPARDVDRLDRWLAEGRHASMEWMARHAPARRDTSRLVPGCRHVVVVTLDHPIAGSEGRASGQGRVARYARGRDYHRVYGKRIRRLSEWLAEASGVPARSFVDTGPVLERAFAERSGLGWIGKNACLISPERGSWFLLGVILTAADLEPDPGPHVDRCGSCTACLEACPTGAIVEAGVVDARLCVSYWTIEHRGPIPAAMRPGIGDWLFGCDDCQTACPWNRTFARPPAPGNAYEPRPELAAIDATELLRLDEATLRARFEGTPLMRARRDGLRRNACVVLGNLGDRAAVPALARVLGDADDVVRSHAAWALGRLGGEDAERALRAALPCEHDETVRGEIEGALDAISKA
jgi:epoxyqueuosine reductase